MSRVLILGATSPIARAIAGEFARRRRCELWLAGRDAGELALIAADVAVRFGVPCRAAAFDVTDYAGHAPLLAACSADGGLDGVVLAAGLMTDQAEAEGDPARARAMFEVNFTGCASVLLTAAACLERQGQGFLCVLGSVAGDRGRRSNYIYGAAKGGLALFTQGLRARLAASGVAVVTIKPGFVDTRMTFGMGGAAAALAASPEAVARAVVAAVERGVGVVYAPAYWRLVMAVVRALPERLMWRLPL